MLTKKKSLVASALMGVVSSAFGADGETQSNATTSPAPSDWMKAIDVPGSGGWEYVNVHGDFDSVAFMTKRLASRNGNVVSIWVRLEFRDLQSTDVANGGKYLSSVSRYEFECSKSAMKMISVSFYSKQNLDGEYKSATWDDDKIIWQPITPGTIGETWLNWACGNIKPASRANPSK